MNDLDSESFSADISSSGNLLINNLVGDSLQVRTSNSGDLDDLGCEVRVQTINLNSSGNLYSVGNPTLDVRTSSLGKT